MMQAHSSRTSSKKKIKFCKLDVLMDECLIEPLSYFTSQSNGTGIVRNDEEMKQFCL